MASLRWAGAVPHRWRIALFGALLLVVLMLAAASDRVGEARSLALAPPRAEDAASTLAPRLVRPRPTDLIVPAAGRRDERTLRSGETLGRVFADFGISGAAAEQATAALARHVDPRRLPVGARFTSVVDRDRRLTALRFEIEGRGVATLERLGESWQSSWRDFTREARARAVRGTLVGSLDESLQQAGAPGELAYAMAEVLQWDLDFNRDLRLGDSFQVLFEESFLDGRRFRLERVLAARYVNRGRTLEAFRFSDGAFYNGEGRPLQKMFLRSPIPYSRVTSRFSRRRFHPVLRTVVPHYGVDYGAPEGTPARVTADGVVAFVGWDGGGGRTVKVRHPNGFLTGYLHLSRFAAGLSPGDPVKQGEVIGYVGATGLATGPHLDYRMQRNGAWVDPLTLTSVPADPIPAAQLGRFHVWREAMVASLDRGSPYPPPTEPAAPAVAASAPSDPARAAAATR